MLQAGDHIRLWDLDPHAEWLNGRDSLSGQAFSVPIESGLSTLESSGETRLIPWEDIFSNVEDSEFRSTPPAGFSVDVRLDEPIRYRYLFGPYLQLILNDTTTFWPSSGRVRIVMGTILSDMWDWRYRPAELLITVTGFYESRK